MDQLDTDIINPVGARHEYMAYRRANGYKYNINDEMLNSAPFYNSRKGLKSHYDSESEDRSSEKEPHNVHAFKTKNVSIMKIFFLS